ncbi:MAG: AAA family ATPase [Deltaproteobacteria bacterium]|nr:AAA family ATPase [Deltaproteobacteria bacterium]
MQAAFVDACASRGRLVLLAGEPGIGKTRTADELATYARSRNAHVFIGRCYEGEGTPPFWPWVQIVRSYLSDHDSATLRTAMGAGAAAIAQVIPDVHERLPDLPVPPVLEPQPARFRFFDSFTTFLKNVAKAQLLVLILDDLHWADTPSLLLLEFLARELSTAHLLVIGTYRDVEVGSAHPLTQTLGELARVPNSQSLFLRCLTESDISRFIELTIARTPAPSLVTAVFEKTGGNLFFVTEVVHTLVRDGRPEQLEELSVEALPLPQRVRTAIAHRLSTLSEPCHRVLTSASAVGRDFDLTVLESVETKSKASLRRMLCGRGSSPCLPGFCHPVSGAPGHDAGALGRSRSALRYSAAAQHADGRKATDCADSTTVRGHATGTQTTRRLGAGDGIARAGARHCTRARDG